MENIKKEVLVTLNDMENNFSKVKQIVDEYDYAIVIDSDKPLYVISTYGNPTALTHDERVDIIAKRALKKYDKAFEELAKR